MKAVRRALRRVDAPRRRGSPARGRRLDAHRPRVETWLLDDPRLSAKRIGKPLRPRVGRVPARTVRDFLVTAQAGDLLFGE